MAVPLLMKPQGISTYLVGKPVYGFWGRFRNPVRFGYDLVRACFASLCGSPWRELNLVCIQVTKQCLETDTRDFSMLCIATIERQPT